MAFSGTLDTVSLTEVLGFLEATQKSGALHVSDDETSGTLYFVAGALAAGESGSICGPVTALDELEVRLIDVCCVLAQRTAGSFEFDADHATESPQIGTFVAAEVLTRAHQVLADWPAIEAVIPAINAHPALPTDVSGNVVVIAREAWPVFRLINGTSNVAELAGQLKRSAFEVCRDVKTLVEAGAVVIQGLDAPEAASPSSPQPVATAPVFEHVSATMNGVTPNDPVVNGEVTNDAVVADDQSASGLVASASVADSAPVPSPYDELRSLSDADDTPNPFENFRSVSEDKLDRELAAKSGNETAALASLVPDSAAGTAGAPGSGSADSGAIVGTQGTAATGDDTKDRGSFLRLFSGPREQ